MIESMYLIVVVVLFLWLVFQLFPLTFFNDVPSGNGNACIEPKEEFVENSKSRRRKSIVSEDNPRCRQRESFVRSITSLPLSVLFEYSISLISWI